MRIGSTAAVAWRRSALALDNWPHTNRPLPWALAAFLAMVWLVPFDSVSLPVSLPLGAKLDRPLLILIAGLWILSLSSVTGVSRLQVTPVHWALLALLTVAALSLVLNAPTIVMLNELESGVRKLALLMSYALLCVIVASAVKPTEVRNFVILMVGLASVTAIGALIEYRTGFNVFFSALEIVLPTEHPGELGNYDSIGRLSVVGPTVHPLAVAMMMSLALPFALIRIHVSRERKVKLLYALAAGLMVAGAVATQRKTSIVAPVIGLMVLTAYRPRAVLQLVPVAILFLGVIHLTAPGALGSVKDQLSPTRLFGALSTKDRQSDYGAIKPDVVRHPLIGRGYESYDQKKYRILDNAYLSMIIGAGVLGVLAYLSVFVTIFVLAHRVARTGDLDRGPPAVAAAAAMASLIIGSALLDTLALPQLAYLICFIGGLTVVGARADHDARPTEAVHARLPQGQLLGFRWMS